MFIAADTLDDLLRRVITKILDKGQRVKPTRGTTTELFGVLLQLNNPRARLSRTEKRRALFSALGEFLWYLSKSNSLEHITYYVGDRYKKESEDGETVRTAYGPRLFANNGHDQVSNVIATLKKKSPSRRAVIQIFEAADGAVDQEQAPCTCTLQFAIRSGKLHMMTFMRSNDAYLGLPHDVFAFTMLQEIVARSLDVKLGKYRHAVGSLHLYDEHLRDAKKMLKEGWQEDIPMPHMPKADPWPALKQLLLIEAQLRDEQDVDVESQSLHPYWKDLARLLQIYRLFRDTSNDAVVSTKKSEIASVRERMSVDVYHPFIEHKRRSKAKKQEGPSPIQLTLSLSPRKSGRAK